MILESIDFSEFYDKISDIFAKHFTVEEEVRLMEYVEILADANFRCYRANMFVIDNRKNDKNPELISDLEWVARSVGEYRVASKANINKYISNVKTTNAVVAPNGWITDDTVYSIGEMIDRLSIETIKREDFARNNRPSSISEASKNLSTRVERYLIQKLEEIDKKGFYECVQEQRTYDIEKILEELVI